MKNSYKGFILLIKLYLLPNKSKLLKKKFVTAAINVNNKIFIIYSYSKARKIANTF